MEHFISGVWLGRLTWMLLGALALRALDGSGKDRMVPVVVGLFILAVVTKSGVLRW